MAMLNNQRVVLVSYDALIHQKYIQIQIWQCLKIGYIPNYSHLIGKLIINHWV